MGVVVSSPVHPSENVLVDLDVALGKDQTIEDNRKETIGVLRRLPNLKNVTERDVVDTCVLLQEAKEKKVQVAQGTGSIPNKLTQKEIDDQIRIYNTERVCVVIDHRIRRFYEDDSWITGLTSGKIKNVEVGTHELNFAQEYMDEFRKKRTEKQDKEKTKNLANIFCRRLNIQEIQDAINHVNRYQSVVRVMRSATSKELRASMKIKYFDLNEVVKGKKEETFVAYHKLLTQSKDEGEKRAVYVKVAGNDNVTGEDIEQCLKEIKRIITHHAAILKINQVISIRKADTKNIMSALQHQNAELELPSEETDEDSDREREYQILLYEAYTDKAVGKADIRMEKDDIQRVLLSRDILKKIDLLKDDQKDDTCFLLESLRKDEMNICEYLEDEMDESDEWSLASLIFDERDNKKTGTTDEKRCKFLTRQEIKGIVKEFKAVWDIQKGNPQELQKHWDTVLRDANVLPDGTKSQKEAEFEKLEGYRKLFKDEVEHQQGKKVLPKAKRGFENLLRRKDVQRIMFELYPAIISINKVIELFIDAKTQGKNEQQDKVKDRQRRKLIDDLEKKCLKAISEKSANLVEGILVDNKNKGFLTLLSGKREGNKQEKRNQKDQVAEDKCFKERLTWKEMRETLSDMKDLECFVVKIISRKVTDTECLDYYKKELKEKADMMKYYRYRSEGGNKDGHEGENYEELWGHTILHLAVCFDKTETASAILQGTPDLINTDIGTWPDNKDTYKGLTPFHIAVAHGQVDLVKRMLKRFGRKKADRIGQRMNGTVFMGQLPFHTAVLCYLNDPNKDDTCRDPENRFVKIIQLLVEKDDVFEEQNYRGDTVLHSIMRFVRCFPSLERRTVDMMSWLESLMDKRAMDAGEDVIDCKRKLFFAKNKTHMTALQLATESGHINLFAYFMKVKGVYLIEYPHDNIYEIRRCDVTEMDKIALITAQRYPTQTRRNDQTAPDESRDVGSSYGDLDDEKGQPEICKSSFSNFRNQSVAELLCCQNLPVATELVRADVFEEMVRRKLNTYWVPFWILSVFHVSLICLLCVYVVARAGAIEGISWAPRGFLEFCNIVTFLCSILYFVQEFPLRYCFAKQPFAWAAVHHNVVYRVFFVLFAVCLFADSILYRIPNSVFVDYKTTFLILAIVVGTWPILFFLRISRRFSLYIVLLNEALFKTVVPFAVLILMQVFVFSACMHATFLHNEQNSSVLEEFHNTACLY
ncbi:uncharacterized protein LOC124132626 isoform X2 [Haliotis rufescens]|uniref:uncharacterized protein LOC124132626 isoform X2 n=1 Tax=Haliotis rufescens TaxID=6454 RepID=UPI00201EE326|nr:uncharacterized protein LOC124132626 isoform X2 [Haliotis rufescens]XP_048248489.1 uncharacterized protein LOC124132626 isoform X2 [Haliotis rufescens]